MSDQSNYGNNKDSVSKVPFTTLEGLLSSTNGQINYDATSPEITILLLMHVCHDINLFPISYAPLCPKSGGY